MTNREAFVTALAVLGATFDRKLTAPAIEGYWLALSDLDESAFRIAMKRAVTECKFMPSPSELLAFARPKVNPGVDALQTWQVVRKAIDKHDYLVATIDFGPLVNAVVRNLGGWDTLCKATLPELDNPGWLRKRFEEVYRLLATAEPTTLHGEPLTGALPANYRNPPNVVIAIDGKPPAPRLTSVNENSNPLALVRDLADKKS